MKSETIPNSGFRTVLCLVPRGLEGKGGIERLYLYLDEQREYPPGYRLTYLPTRGSGSLMASIFYTMRSLIIVWSRLLNKDFDILHINLSGRLSPYRKLPFFILARLFSVPVVIQYHGSGFDSEHNSRKLWVWLSNFMLRRADIVIALGKYWRDFFENKCGVSAKRLKIVYNAVPDFGPVIQRIQRTTFSICFAGQVGRRKGVDLLIHGLESLGLDFEWTCTIAGDGDQKEFLDTLSSGLVGNRVRFTGWCSVEEIHQLMLQADVVILPSRAEVLPVSLIEGAAAGAALISTDVGATREIVEHEVNGLIVDATGKSIAEGLRRLASDFELLRSMRIMSRKKYEEQFSIGRMCEDLGKAYDAAIYSERGF